MVGQRLKKGVQDLSASNAGLAGLRFKYGYETRDGFPALAMTISSSAVTCSSKRDT
jgi:hypothetical protein